jgi:predicted transcriptional regulator
MTPEEHRENLRRVAAVRDSEPAAALAALRAGVRQVDIAHDLGRTREHVRRITRAAETAEAQSSADSTPAP